MFGSPSMFCFIAGKITASASIGELRVSEAVSYAMPVLPARDEAHIYLTI